MNDHCIFHLIIFILRKNNIHSILQRKSVRETFQCLSSHNYNISCCFLTKELHIWWNAHQQSVLVTDSPIIICCYDCLHTSSPLHSDWYILNLRMCLISFQFHIIRCEIIEVFHFRVQPELRCRKRFSWDQFLNHRNMSVINMCICDHMNKLSDLHVTYLRQHMKQYCILTHIPVICRKDILRTLVKNSI